MNACDAYISMHRAEGLGLGLLEAMQMGKPAVATGYSGNLEFMNRRNSILIDYKLTCPKTDFNPYKDVTLWAEPDAECAATALRKLYEDRLFAAELGLNGLRSITDRFSIRKYQQNLYALLKDIKNAEKH